LKDRITDKGKKENRRGKTTIIEMKGKRGTKVLKKKFLCLKLKKSEGRWG